MPLGIMDFQEDVGGLRQACGDWISREDHHLNEGGQLLGVPDKPLVLLLKPLRQCRQAAFSNGVVRKIQCD